MAGKYSNQDLMTLYPLDRREDYNTSLHTISGSSEIDIRTEFLRTIFGGPGEIPKGQPILIRRMRRDPLTMAKTECGCKDSFTREPDLDTICPICLGEGYLWDEAYVHGYKRVSGSETSLARRVQHEGPGVIYDDTFRFYFPYDANIRQGDSIIEVILDVEGDIEEPARRQRIWRPSVIEQKRLDTGRIEYYIVSCAQRNSIYIEKAELIFINNP